MRCSQFTISSRSLRTVGLAMAGQQGDDRSAGCADEERSLLHVSFKTSGHVLFMTVNLASVGGKRHRIRTFFMRH